MTDKSIQTIKHVLLDTSDDHGLETPKQKKVRITLDNKTSDENDAEDFEENGSQGDSSDE